MEAMACGCAVASSNVTSLPEQVGDAGLLFDPTDVSSMAEAMRLLAADEALRKTLIARGQIRVREFSSRNFLRTVAQAYEFARGIHVMGKAA
jgi:glycosyltransferase involved in cell wall biosynthesis